MGRRRRHGGDDLWCRIGLPFNGEVACSSVVVVSPPPLGQLLEHDVAAYGDAPHNWVISPVCHRPGLVADEDHAAAVVIELLQMRRRRLGMSNAAERPEVLDARPCSLSKVRTWSCPHRSSTMNGSDPLNPSDEAIPELDRSSDPAIDAGWRPQCPAPIASGPGHRSHRTRQITCPRGGGVGRRRGSLSGTSGRAAAAVVRFWVNSPLAA